MFRKASRDIMLETVLLVHVFEAEGKQVIPLDIVLA